MSQIYQNFLFILSLPNGQWSGEFLNEILFQIEIVHAWSYRQILWSELASKCHVIMAHKIDISKIPPLSLLNYEIRECTANR